MMNEGMGKRQLGRWFGASVVASSLAMMVVPMGAQAAVAPLPPPITKTIAVDGSPTTFTIQPLQMVRVEVSGLYNYDTNIAGDLFADPVCSLPTPLWRDMVDAGDDAGAGRSNPWHRNRFGAGFYPADGPASVHWMVDPMSSPLSVAINNFSSISWLPTKNEGQSDASGRRNDPGCNTVDHAYYIDITAADFTPRDLSFSVYDPYYGDNAPIGSGLSITWTVIGGV
jgi:hypothetical protein